MSEASIGSAGRTIQIFLAEGSPAGLRVASIHGWTGSILVSQQSAFDKLLARPETDRTGVYILFGSDPEDTFTTRAYIGEADSVRQRITQSANQKTFWETALVITTSDEALTKGHVRFLEARLIQLALEAGRVKLDNVQEPRSERRWLPEADQANMEAFLSNIALMLPVLGLELLKPAPKVVSRPEQASVTKQFEIRHKSRVKAFAVEQDGEFVVLQGSQALRDTVYESKNYLALKNELIKSKILKQTDNQQFFEFASSYPFSSPSAASAVVLDRNSNGRTEWKVIDSPMSYADWQQSKVEAVTAS